MLGFGYLSTFVFALISFATAYCLAMPCKAAEYIAGHNYEIYLVHHRIVKMLVIGTLTAESSLVIVLCLCATVLILIWLASEKLREISAGCLKRISGNQGGGSVRGS